MHFLCYYKNVLTRNLIWWLQLETRQSSGTCPLLSRVLERYIDNPNRQQTDILRQTNLPLISQLEKIREWESTVHRRLFTADYNVRMSRPLGRIIISTKRAPAAIGPYNQAVQVNINLFSSHLLLSNLNSPYQFRLDW